MRMEIEMKCTISKDTLNGGGERMKLKAYSLALMRGI